MHPEMRAQWLPALAVTHLMPLPSPLPDMWPRRDQAVSVLIVRQFKPKKVAEATNHQPIINHHFVMISD